MAFSSDSVQLFLAVLDHGSFSAAARALGRVPSAVSMAMGHLEAELDMLLFDRSGREPRPTAAARALEPQARLLAAQLQQLNAQALSLPQGLEERLTLAIAPELLQPLLDSPRLLMFAIMVFVMVVGTALDMTPTILLLTPVLAKYLGPLAPISCGGASTMDTTLPVITRYCGKDWIFVSIVHAMILDFSVPFWVIFFCTL